MLFKADYYGQTVTVLETLPDRGEETSGPREPTLIVFKDGHMEWVALYVLKYKEETFQDIVQRTAIAGA